PVRRPLWSGPRGRRRRHRTCAGPTCSTPSWPASPCRGPWRWRWSQLPRRLHGLGGSGRRVGPDGSRPGYALSGEGQIPLVQVEQDRIPPVASGHHPGSPTASEWIERDPCPPVVVPAVRPAEGLSIGRESVVIHTYPRFPFLAARTSTEPTGGHRGLTVKKHLRIRDPLGRLPA